MDPMQHTRAIYIAVQIRAFHLSQSFHKAKTYSKWVYFILFLLLLPLFPNGSNAMMDVVYILFYVQHPTRKEIPDHKLIALTFTSFSFFFGICFCFFKIMQKRSIILLLYIQLFVLRHFVAYSIFIMSQIGLRRKDGVRGRGRQMRVCSSREQTDGNGKSLNASQG